MSLLGSLLAGVALGLLATLAPLPDNAAAMGAWIASGQFQLVWAGELLFFSVASWLAATIGNLAREAYGSARSATGAAGLMIAFVALLGTLLALGRLVYPVSADALSHDSALLVASTVYGTVHLAYLGFAVAALAAASSPGIGLFARCVNVGSGGMFLIGSFLWLLPGWANVFAAFSISVWGAYTALTMRNERSLSRSGSGR